MVAVTKDSGDLLVRMRDQQVTANRAEMARARTAVRLFQRFSADYEARRSADPHFTATPLSELVTEVQPVTGQSVTRIRADVEAVLLVDQELPWLSAYLDSGRLDLFRARPVTDAVKEDLADHPEARSRFAELMRAWFAKAAAEIDRDTAETGLLNRTHQQIRNHVHYVVAKVLAGEFDDRFKRRHRQRRVSTIDTGDGMAALTVDTDVVSARKASAHLDLLARDSRKAGDPRTLEQLRADLAIDLLCGQDAPVGSLRGRWARPVVNVTVPVQTLMGLSDEPGRMADRTLPASLVRHVAADPESTWHRLLTDPARHAVELSTHSYRPTAPIWRQVVASRPTCFAPTCDRPATECDIDHHIPYPVGATSTSNLGPGCRRHHLSKHAPGASLRHERDGTLRYTTRSGMTHLVAPVEQAVCDDPAAGPLWERLIESQPNVAELTHALDGLRGHQRIVADTEHRIARVAEQIADYQASYPHASEEEIDLWVFGPEDPHHPAPQITRRAPRPRWDTAPEEPEMSALAR